MATTIELLTCKQCGHSWYPRSDQRPKQCPNCFSRKWDRDKGAPDLPRHRTRGEAAAA